ncbi:MAG: hypothetical protein CMH56_01950 [Myxococcales bacterium]|nr:hypothetical protein [Myxococcales bacterium]
MALLWACRPDPGPHYYESQEDFSQSSVPGGNFLAGEVPYQVGTPRLNVGVFYEGDSSDVIAINEADIFYYIYDQVMPDESRISTFTQTTDEDRIEGTYADHFMMGDLGWFGCGVHWDDERDLSSWSHLAISFKTSSASVSDIQIGMNNIIDEQETAFFLPASDYGFVNDGQWHRVVLPMAHFENLGLNPTLVRSPLILSSGTLAIAAGEELLVDDAYFFVGETAETDLPEPDAGP